MKRAAAFWARRMLVKILSTQKAKNCSRYETIVAKKNYFDERAQLFSRGGY